MATGNVSWMETTWQNTCIMAEDPLGGNENMTSIVDSAAKPPLMKRIHGNNSGVKTEYTLYILVVLWSGSG